MIIKHFQLALRSLKITTMDRMESKLAFIFVAIGILIDISLRVIFFRAVFMRVDAIAGWSFSEVLVLIGVYELIRNISWMSYRRGFNILPQHIEDGSLDFFLLKPIELRKYFIYNKIDIVFEIPSLIYAVVLIVFGVSQSPLGFDLPMFLLMLVLAVVIHYSLTVIIYTVNFFYLIPITGLLHLEIFKLGQYPISIYKGFMGFILSYIVPLALLFTFPAKALFGSLSLFEFSITLLLTSAFYFISKIFWNFGLKHYESARG